MSIEKFLKEAASVKPSKRQLDWFNVGFYAFVHFSPNTYTGKEWGDGTEDPAIFNPTDLNCDEWCEAILSAGMKGMILTAKHHDGFCLWPSAYTEHSVKNCPIPGLDVVKEASEACRRHGLKFGFYLSPWDRNNKLYGTPEYNDYYCSQLTELLTGYGDIFCVWFDGACGEGPNGKKQVYDFPRYIELIRKYQPDAVIFNDGGPDIRWVGNEAGQSRHAEWAVVPAELCQRAAIQTGKGPLNGELVGLYNSDPDLGTMPQILYSKGLTFCPSETDMSIRPGWFYHPTEEPHSLERLFDTYLRTVGGNGCFNLNVPPMPSGRFDPRDIQRLKELGEKLSEAFRYELSSEAAVSEYSPCETQLTRTLSFSEKKAFSIIELSEDIAQGQRVESFTVRAHISSDSFEGIQTIYSGTTIGNRRFCRFSRPVITDELIISITASRDVPVLKPVKVYG